MASPFPSSIPAFIAPLPIPVTGEVNLSELEFGFNRTEERGYTIGADTMYAASYEAVTALGNLSIAFVANENTGRVTQALAFAATAYARRFALVRAYESQTPPQPVPDNPGYWLPLSRSAVEILDGTVRLRGVAGGLRTLDPSLVSSVEVRVPVVWSGGGGGGGDGGS